MSSTDDRLGERTLGSGRFVLVRRLGAGATGIVFEAIDRERGEHVALKTLRAVTAEATFRLKNEFRALQGLHHPNLVRLGELFCEQGQWFFTMELVSGRHFLDHVRARGAPLPAAAETTTTSAEVGIGWPRFGPALAAATAERAAPARDWLSDEARLRDALGQLAQALAALHQAGKVHRDVKASNVLVDDKGRVVLVDFGAIVDAAPRSRETKVIGTVAYMAPEQAAGDAVGPAADWFAVGVLLYQSLTGQLPFAGSSRDLRAAGVQRALPPASVAPEVPGDLAALCEGLLAPAAADRPGDREILRRLGVEDAGAGARPERDASPPELVGRRCELERLQELYARTRTGVLASVAVVGPSGVGKSALVRHFAASLGPGVLALFGRCYEREVAPYKAMDELIDRLAEYLLGLKPLETALLVPRNAHVLARVFPVMGRVPAIVDAPAPLVRIEDPRELRRRAFAALRELLMRLCDRGPLVLVIDDVQWADPDSFALLAEVLGPPDAPALLLIATMRSSAAPGEPEGRPSQPLPVVSEVITLGGLSRGEAIELAARHLTGAGSLASDAALVAAETDGHPLLIAEVVRALFAAGRGGGLEPSRALAFEEVVWRRIVALDAVDRRLLELLALAGRPMPREQLAQAASVADAEIVARAGRLSADNLLRTWGAGRSDAVELFHDRVGAAIRSNLDRATRAAHHRRWAEVLEAARGSDHRALVVHWQEAGEPARASVCARQAAREAARALALERAAELFERALAMRPAASDGPRRDPADEPLLEAELADALANAGRGKEAARFYLAAAAGDEPEPTRLVHRQRAAEELLRSGYIDEGLAAFEDLLRSIKMPMPRTPRRALVGLLVRRAQLRLRGLGYRSRPAAEVDPWVLSRIDCCWSVSTGLAVVDTISGAYYQARQLQLALEAGEPGRIARAFAAEAALEAATGRGGARAAHYLAQARTLAEPLGEPRLDALIDLWAGVAAYLGGRFDESASLCGRAEQTLRERCAGVAWERDTVRLFMAFSRYYLGDLQALAALVPAWTADALRRGDIYLATNLQAGQPNVVKLIADDPAGAREAVTVGFGPAQRRYYFQTYLAASAECGIDLYLGDGVAAHERLMRVWKSVTHSLLMRIQFVRVEALQMRGRCAVAAAVAQPSGRARRVLLAEAGRCAARIARERTMVSLPFAALLRSGLAAASGDDTAALAALDEADGGFARAGMKLHQAAVRWRRRALGATDQPGDDPAAWFHAQGVKRPERMVAMLAPGFDR